MNLEFQIKKRIKHLLEEKKIKKTKLSVEMGYRPTFLNTILGKENKFFNLEQIEKICAILNYPVYRLVFEAVANPEEEPEFAAMIIAEAEPASFTRRQEDQIEGLTKFNRGVVALSKEKQREVMHLALSALVLAEGQPPALKKSNKTG